MRKPCNSCGKGEKITLVRGVVAKPATAGNEVNEDAEGYRATEGTTRAKRGKRPKVKEICQSNVLVL